MTARTRWLKWNGVYDLAGICNRPLTPLDSVGDEIKAIKERLYLLGFDCGTLDANMEDKTQKALRTFNGYWNHPTINRLTDPVVLPPGVPAPLAAPYFDQMTIACLQEIEDELQSRIIPEEDVAGPANAVAVNRNRIGRTGYSGTINTSIPLAVKIISTPGSIMPFAEYAAIKIQINGFEKVQSLLFRVYRNFEADVDEISMPAEKLVYQEILDRPGIEGLVEKGPKTNIGQHHPAKAFIMRYEVTGGFSGFFNSSLGAAYEKLHAPYKIRVWVSTVENFFKDYVFNPTAALPSSRKNQGEGKNLHYLDTEERKEVQRGRRKSLTAQEFMADTSYRNEPDINHMDTVHDKSNKAKADESESAALRANWNKLAKFNVALSQKKLWTLNDELEANLIEEPCPVPHDSHFILENQIQDEMFPTAFAKDPVGTYLEYRKKLDADGVNFKFEELSEVFANIRRHINLVKRRLCCGQWRQVEEPVKDDTAIFFAGTILPEIDRLEVGGFPYDDSFLFCEKFMSFISHIVHEAVVRPELDFYVNNDLQIENKRAIGSPFFAKWLRDRRNRIDGCRSTSQSEYGINTGHNFHTTQNTAATSFVAESTFDTYPKLKAEVSSFQHGRNIAKPILIPSYNPLDPYFFVKIRAVPMYAIGMLDMQYLNADGLRQIPVGFFEHDMFHVCTPAPGTQQWKTLYTRLCEVIDASPTADQTTIESVVYRKWQANVEKITQKIDSFAGTQRDTFSFLLFWILHEPKSGVVAPAMPEPKLMSDRLVQQNTAGEDLVLKAIRDEDAVDFFGDYSHPFIQYLFWATTRYAFLMTELDDAV